MSTHKNGYVPRGELVSIKSGTHPVYGFWEHLLTRKFLVKHNALVRRARERTGRTLAAGDGYSFYRPMSAQLLARKIYGLGAADPGKSSHGGEFWGKDSLACDYSNWQWVYENHGGREAFFADCRAVGLEPGVISRANGYPDEPWHVVCWEPFGAAPASEVSAEFPDSLATPKPDPEEDEMGFYFGPTDGSKPFMFFNQARGKSREISKDEWSMLRALQRGAVPPLPLPVFSVSRHWYDKAVALGTY